MTTPDRIRIDPGFDGWNGQIVGWPSDRTDEDMTDWPEYVRADLLAQAEAENERLWVEAAEWKRQAFYHNAEHGKCIDEIRKLRGALQSCIIMLDDLCEESGREVMYGEEDAFRMGEWFDEDDLAAIDRARAALQEDEE